MDKKVPSYCTHPKCLIASGCSGPCRYGQPAQPAASAEPVTLTEPQRDGINWAITTLESRQWSNDLYRAAHLRQLLAAPVAAQPDKTSDHEKLLTAQAREAANLEWGEQQRDRADKWMRDFQNFHRLLCERFGYGHDEQDWYRDQVSLMEHIAAQPTGKSPLQVAAQPSVPEPLKYGGRWKDHYVTGWNNCRAAMLEAEQAQQDSPHTRGRRSMETNGG